MPLERIHAPPRATPLRKGSQTLYEVTLSAAPSPEWRAAFLRPPSRMTRPTARPGLARVELHGPEVWFRCTPSRLHFWLRWIDRWVDYANSIVEE